MMIPNLHRRGRVDVMADVLNAAIDGARGTPIMYKANLNFAMRNKYLTEAINAGLMTVKVNSPLIYITTDKGHEWLKKYRQLAIA
jgi:predicted transcriptional regulator